MSRWFLAVVLAVPLLGAGCGGEEPAATLCEDTALPSRPELRCEAEFRAQAARPLDSSLPGAYTVKTIVDLEDVPYFLDTNTYPVHAAFAVDHLGWPPGLSFTTNYYDPSRRFLLGSITRFDDAGVWAYELAPYDTATAEQITRAFRDLAAASYFGGELRFHPTSQPQLELAATLPHDVPVVTTDEIYANTRYQPLNLGETIAQVRVLTAADLETTYVSPRELVVLDEVPNDITVVAGTVTQQLQTPLSHVNVLAQQRGTPNMGLRDALDVFTPYDGRWVKLTVGAFDYTLAPATQAEADAWWDAHRPTPIVPPTPDVTVTALTDVDDVGLDDVAWAGGKASHFGALRTIGDPVIVRDGFVIPVHFYDAFLAANGIDVEIATMLADPTFQADGNVRRERLSALRDHIQAAPVDAALVEALRVRITDQLGAVRVRFRSSTTAEDLDGWTGAGLYESTGVDLAVPADSIEHGLREVWSSVWTTRAFEERAYVSIDHTQVAMAILVHPAYVNEAANGVAITANVYDPAPGGEDAFYVNAQLGETSVVQPDPSIACDQLLYYHFHNGQPATYLTHSTLTPDGAPVLTRRELYDLGRALDAIRDHFDDVYDPPPGWGAVAMDVEWKLATLPDGTRRIEIKQARPYPGRGSDSGSL